MPAPMTPAEFTDMLTAAGIAKPRRRFTSERGAPVRLLSRPEVAKRIGVKPDSLNRYRLPPPDAQIGARQVGWLADTIDAWHSARPSQQATRGHVR